MDGTLTGLPQCHLHGCFTHAPVGYFPPSHCTRHSIGMVCTKNVGVRTLRIYSAKPHMGQSCTIRTKHGSAVARMYLQPPQPIPL